MSSQGDTSGDGATIRERTSTYNTRKVEMQELQKAFKALRQKLEELEKRRQARGESLQNAITVREELYKAIKQNAIVITGAQSLLSSYSTLAYTPPIGRYIHLPVDQRERYRIIQAMRAPKMRDATTFLLARCHFLDLGRQYRQVESMETNDGGRMSIFWDVTKFERKDLTVLEVFNAMLFFMSVQEIVLSEKLGPLFIRESDVTPDHALEAEQVRILSAHDDGLCSEKNLVVHSQYVSHDEILRQARGILTVDFVDHDDVFPYRPQSRIRKDMTLASLVIATAPDVVSIVRWAVMKIHPSVLATSDRLDKMAHHGAGSENLPD